MVITVGHVTKENPTFLGSYSIRTCHTCWDQVQGLLLPLDRSRIGPSEINFIIAFSLLRLFFFIEQVTCPSASTPESPAGLPIYNARKGVGLVLVIFFWSIAIKFKTGIGDFLFIGIIGISTFKRWEIAIKDDIIWICRFEKILSIGKDHLVVGIFIRHSDRDQRLLICFVFEDTNSDCKVCIAIGLFHLACRNLVRPFDLPIRTKFSRYLAISRLVIDLPGLALFLDFGFIPFIRDIVTTQVNSFFLWLGDLLAGLVKFLLMVWLDVGTRVEIDSTDQNNCSDKPQNRPQVFFLPLKIHFTTSME